MSKLGFLQAALLDKNITAMQMTIRHCEGTDAADGYNYLFGSSPNNDRRFTDMSKHPNIAERFTPTQTSSAAGAYQIMFITDEELSNKLMELGLSKEDAFKFDASTQDLKCCLLFSNYNVCQKIMDGHFTEAINVLNKCWASLPGSPYGQPVRSMEYCMHYYIQAGGAIIS